MAAPKTGTIRAVWRIGATVYAAVAVTEDGAVGNVEYVGTAALNDDAGNPKTVSQLKADLAADVTARRVRQLDGPPAVGGVSGNVNV